MRTGISPLDLLSTPVGIVSEMVRMLENEARDEQTRSWRDEARQKLRGVGR